ncbi:MAG: DNA phosphorothioation-associated protein 4 [Chthoniobacteraceae bacterium]
MSTIADAAEAALREIGRTATLDEIYAKILERNLYTFDTDVPEHVLRTQIHRYCDNTTRVDKYSTPRFTQLGEDTYAMTNQRTRQASGIRRIHRAKDKEPIIQKMIEEIGVFREIWRLLLFAAVLGMKGGRRDALEDVDSGKGIDQATFGNSRAWPGVVYLLSLVDSGNPSVLSDTSEDARIQVFEEYANGGLALMKEHFDQSPSNLQSLIDLAERYGATQTAAPPVVDLSFL